ncbi:MAG: hypothetical protein FWD58_00590 [Firmicutes bacterium]|nr:hypothetical protein [Bacillota bacterium]
MSGIRLSVSVQIVRELDEGYTVYCREDTGVIVAKTSQPPIALTASESRLSAAFWDFLEHTVGSLEYSRPDNARTIERLQKYIAEVQAETKESV